MPHQQQFYDWHDRVQGLFPDLKPHHRRALAEYSFGMVLARCCGLTLVVHHLATLLVLGSHALTQRLRELTRPASAQRGSARSQFDYTLCFRPLLRWAASGHPDKRIVIALDPTYLTDRFRVLCVAVLYRGTALPVAWHIQTANEKGPWNDIWKSLLDAIKAELGPGWTVLVLTDRGLWSADLFRAIQALGWRPLMRASAQGKFKPEGWHKGYEMAKFAGKPGRRWMGKGLAFPTGEKLECTLLAVWEEGHEEAWLILTDLPGSGANPAWYAFRMWIEQGFRAIKRGQWHWERSRMEETDRAARLWAVMALATVWMIEVGGEGKPAEVPKVPRRLSLLTEGLVRVWAALMHGQPLPTGQLVAAPWPVRGWEPDELTENDFNPPPPETTPPQPEIILNAC